MDQNLVTHLEGSLEKQSKGHGTLEIYEGRSAVIKGLVNLRVVVSLTFKQLGVLWRPYVLFRGRVVCWDQVERI